MLNKKYNTNIKRIITFTLLFMLALVTSPLGQVTKVDALQPLKQSGTGTAKNQRYWDDVGRSFILTDTQSYVTSLSKSDSGFIVNTDTTSARWNDAKNKTLTDVLSGGEHRIRGSHSVRRWDSTNGFYNFSFRLVPANFVQGSYTRGRSLLDNLYLESSTSATTIDSRLANGTHGWINPIISVSTSATHASLRTQRLWGQGSGNYVRPAYVYSRSDGALAAASWGTATANYFRDAWDMRVTLPKIDQFPPTISFNPNSNGTYTNSNRTTTVTVTDAGTGVKHYRTRIETTSGSNTTTSAWSGYTSAKTKSITFSGNGRQRVQVQATDNNGNTSTKWSGYFYVDKQAPTLSSYKISNHRYKNGNDYWYRPGDTWIAELTGYENNSGHRVNYIRLHATGNDNRARHYYADASTKIDEWMKGTYTQIDSGRVINKSWTFPYEWKGKVKSNSSGRTFNVQYYFTDNAGNSRGYTNTGGRIRVDGVGPVISANTSSRGWGSSNPSVTLSYSDALSGVNTRQYAWSTSTSTPSSWTNYSSAVSRSSNGTWYLHARSTDNVGNVTTQRFGPYRVDKTAPNGTISGNPTAWTSGNVTLTFNATDSGGSGVRRVRQSGGTWVNGSTTSRTVTANGTYSFEVEDNAGNKRTVSTTVNRIDKTKPTISATRSTSAWTNKPVDITVNANDTQSGVEYIEMLNGGSGHSAIGPATKWGGGTFTKTGNGIRIKPGSNGQGGIKLPADLFQSNRNYVLSFDITKHSGNIPIIGGHLQRSTSTTTYINGTQVSGNYSGGVTYPNNGGKNTVEVHFNTNTSATDNNIYIQPNRGNYSGKTYDATISNIRIRDKSVNDEIGGTNLLLGSGEVVTNNSYGIKTYTPSTPLVAGQQYTVTIDITPGSGVTHVTPYLSSGYSNLGSMNVNGTGRQTITRTFNASYHADRPLSASPNYANMTVYRFPNNGTTGNTTIHRIKVEKGSQSTPWTAAPEDVSMANGDNQVTRTFQVSQNGTYKFRASDGVGWYQDTSISITNIDTTAPNGTITPSTTSWTNEDVTLTFNGSDTDGSGVKRVRRPNGTWVNGSSATHTVSSNGSYTFRVEDNAGNYRDITRSVSNIDKISPSESIIKIKIQ